MSSAITSIYQLLDYLRDRPAMYGIDGRSFRLLQTFLSGLSFGNLDPGDPPFWDFPLWAAVQTGHTGNSFPWRWLETSQSDADAYATWFRLLDEYRRCRVVELARLPGTVVRFRQGWRSEPGKPLEPYVPPTPDAIRLGQFAPSPVFFVEQLFADRAEKLDASFHPTPEDAINEARRWWQVDPGAWNLPRPAIE